MMKNILGSTWFSLSTLFNYLSSNANKKDTDWSPDDEIRVAANIAS